jgi:hypothetical protein
MVTLSRGLFQVMISLDCFLFVSIISQNPEDWEFSLVHLPNTNKIMQFHSNYKYKKFKKTN